MTVLPVPAPPDMSARLRPPIIEDLAPPVYQPGRPRIIVAVVVACYLDYYYIGFLPRSNNNDQPQDEWTKNGRPWWAHGAGISTE